MPTTRITLTTWKAKQGRGAMRVALLAGAYASRNGGFLPTIILRLHGRRGGRLVRPPERLELKHQDFARVRADLYHQMDVDWVIEGEEATDADTEGELTKAIGRRAMGIIGGASAYEFLASWFPICVHKRVYRSPDGLSTVRVLNVFNKHGTDMMFISTKRAGHPERFETYAGGQQPLFTCKLKPPRLQAHKDLSERQFVTCDNEADFHAALGGPLLAWVSQSDYGRLVRNGNKSDAKPADHWGDGYDFGGNGPPPPPSAPSLPMQRPPMSPKAEQPVTAPRLVPINAPSTRPTDEQAVEEGYEDDPSFGLY